MRQLNAPVNLLVCQKSKIQDWIDHFTENYDYMVLDLTKKKQFDAFTNSDDMRVGIINYDLIWRRPILMSLRNFTLMLDESSLIQNGCMNGRCTYSKRAKFILTMRPANIILLSGTPCSGKYEKLYSQMKLLGWDIKYSTFYNSYVKYHVEVNHNLGNSFHVVDGYKNVEHLKEKLAEYGAVFRKTDEILTLPQQTDQIVKIKASTQYKHFKEHKVIETDEYELVGDSTFAELMALRKLCGMYSEEKLQALSDLIDSTEDRLIIFYNFDIELEKIMKCCKDIPISIINGKKRDLTAYEQYDHSITLVQYQAGSKGLNLQKANKIIFYTPTLSCEDYMQSKKRIHRLGQNRPCFYYYMVVEKSVEERIYNALNRGVDYTDDLFEADK